jgi:hypothetical protein
MEGLTSSTKHVYWAINGCNHVTMAGFWIHCRPAKSKMYHLSSKVVRASSIIFCGLLSSRIIICGLLNKKKDPDFSLSKPRSVQGGARTILRHVQFLHGPKKDFAPRLHTTKKRNNCKKLKLSGGESNPGLLRVVLSNDKQKY